ncbi:MAG: hypothetical protein JWN70_4648 [Planctomycetaceae bacterium]|nr:hypothetical protein [Planctomycetaceae bacterium]
MSSQLRWLKLVLVALLITGCAGETPPTQAEIDHLEHVKIEKLTTLHLPNAVRVHSKVISGGLPEGLVAFEELRSLGVKTVISVDGAKPDLISAEKCGLRYVHLPHGYDGIPQARAAELAKAVRDLPGPIYIHCHHGKHRSPAAAATACVAAGLIDREAGLSVLQVAGTSANYRGLFESAQTAKPLGKAVLDQLDADFPATAKLPVTAEAMVAVEHTLDHLKSFEKAGWKLLPDQPDLTPEHEALLLREHYAELLRIEAVQQQPERFRQLLSAGETAAQELETALRAWSGPNTNGPVPAAVRAAFQAVNDNCKTCHQEFRDVPLSEKGARVELETR